MQSYFRNIRFYILFFSFIVSVSIYGWVMNFIPSGTLQTIRLTQLYALTAFLYLYVTLMATPVTRFFPLLPYRGQYLRARRALGVSAWYFAVLHASFAFFGQLGGFEGLAFLNNTYLIALSFGFLALVILSVMTVTASDVVVNKLTFPKWKILHRFVYIAGIALLVHSLMLGTHFNDLSGFIPQISFAAIAILLILDARRLDTYLQQKFSFAPQFGVALLSVGSFLAVLYGLLYLPASSSSPLNLGIHSQHVQIARENQSNLGANKLNSSFPGLQGDPTKRYTVSFLHQESVMPGEDVTLAFKIFDASNGNQQYLFQRTYEKFMHLIVVDSSLDYFSHIHPEADGNGFSITTQFPKAGRYHLYTDFQPLGAIEQQFGFTVVVGEKVDSMTSVQQPDTKRTKQFGDYSITLSHDEPLLANKLSIGEQLLTFTLADAKTKKPVASLKPYLASFGHLVMINKKTYEYIHVHPTNQTAPKPNENSGPTVEFLPLGLYGPIKPGVYRVFAQFNPNNELFTADFTIEVK